MTDARSLLEAGRDRTRSDPDEAFRLFGLAADAAQASGNDLLEVEALLEAIRHGLNHCRPGPDVLAVLNRRALARLASLDRPGLTGRAYLQRAEIEDVQGDDAAAERSLTTALGLLERDGAPADLGSARHFLGGYKQARGELDAAETLYRLALEAWRPGGSVGHIAGLQMKLARLEASTGRVAEAIKTAGSALELLLHAHPWDRSARRMSAECRVLLGKWLVETGQPDTAVAHLREAESIFRLYEMRQADEVAAQLAALQA